MTMALDILRLLGGQGVTLVKAVRQKIRENKRESAELAQLERTLLGGGRGVRVVEANGNAPLAKTMRGSRVDWKAVLATLPPVFTIEDVMKNPAAAAKGRPQVYPALDRFQTLKLVKRVGKGQYQRMDLQHAAKKKAPVKRAKSAKRQASKARTTKTTDAQLSA
jgi:hypothetical protein